MTKQREPWLDIDPGMIEWDRKRRERDQQRYPAQVPIHAPEPVEYDREKQEWN